MKISALKNIYFMGIGGAGMSALARYFHCLEKNVRGFDQTSTSLTLNLEKEGMSIFYTWDKSQIEACELLIYTPAIPSHHEVFEVAAELGIPMLKRAQVLGEISKNYRAIAVAGTHGKTTTSTMITHLLRNSGIDCTAFLGGISLNLKSNFIHGKSDVMVVEADEYDRSFLHLFPFIGIITSMDEDHLDIYETREQMNRAYFNFQSRIHPNGSLIIHHSLKEQLDWSVQPTTYGINDGDYQVSNTSQDGEVLTFNVIRGKDKFYDFSLKLPGDHNLSNMIAALAAVHALGLNISRLKEVSKSFMGIKRRFEICYKGDFVSFIDDYAHHPVEIQAALQATQSLYPSRNKVVLFQPHLYSRTRDFFKEFASALQIANEVMLLDIYPAREEPIDGINSELIAQYIVGTPTYVIEREEIIHKLRQSINSPTVIVMLGAGDIEKEKNVILELVKELDSKNLAIE